MRSIGQRHDSVLAPGVTFEERYEIVGQLGEGGFGTVYEARQLSTGQPVALKILRVPDEGGAQTGTRVARFLRETRLCAQLRHPNIVALVDSGQLADGTPYIAFTFVPGQNLAALLATEGALAPREARHLMLQVLDALACAHAQGVVHRDLKPSNIMVIPTGARRNALVLDFGIGALLDEKRATRLTGSRDALGTPGYGAPEQWRGGEPSPRADLFSWGLVFLECLTGTPVYGGAAGEIFYRLLGPDSVPMPPALERHPLGGLVARALRKDVAARDVTARGLFDALDTCDLRGLSRGALRAGGDSSAGWLLDSAPTLDSPSPAFEGERRQVTAVSCVLGGSHIQVAGPRADDAEDARLRAGLVLAAGIARRHGGHVAAMLGDELLVYFGYPRAEEDDARRAARAALGIVGAIEAKGDGLRARVGVHAGLVVTHDDGDAALAAGCTSRLVSRLARSAPPGAVLVTADAHKILRKRFAFEAGGVQSIEEVGAPLKVFQLAGLDRVIGPMLEVRQASLVGRDQEMALLLDRWRRTRAGGGQVCLVTGEPGIGKSRLALELRARLVNEAHMFVEGRCAPDTQNNALFPIADLLGRTLGLDTESSPAGKIARLESELARHGLTPAEAMPLFLPLFSLPSDGAGAPLDVSPQKLKELTLNGILALLFAMGEERPVLLVVEDLHWADPTTLELLGQLVREVPSAPMCVLLTARPEFSPAFPTTGVLQVHLNRLERAQIEVMVGALTGKKALPAGVLEQVAGRTDGVPLFVEELTRMMVDSRTLVEREDHYELSGSLSDVEIPSTLRGLLTARLDRLGRAKDTAQLAAALGREFSVEVLAAVSPLRAAEVQEDLERLMHAGLVLRKRRARDPVAVFKHALVRDAAYESLAASARQKVHARIAAALEERFQTIVEGQPELLAYLAYHYERGGHGRKAAHFHREAGLQAFRLGASREAITCFEQALALLDAMPLDVDNRTLKIETYLPYSNVLKMTYGWNSPEILDALHRARGLCRELGAEDRLMPFMFTLWAHHLTRLDLAGALAIALENTALGKRLGSTEILVYGYLAQANTEFWMGEFGACAAHVAEASSIIEQIDDLASCTERYGLDPRSLLLNFEILSAWMLGRLERIHALVARGERMLAELEHPTSKALMLTTLAWQAFNDGDVDACGRHADELLRVSVELVYYRPFAELFLGWVEGLHQDPIRGIERVDRGYGEVRAQGEGLLDPIEALIVSDLHRRLGRTAHALQAIERSLERGRASNNLAYRAELLRVHGELEVPHHRARAIDTLRAALALARKQSAQPFATRIEGSLAAFERD